MQGKVAESDLPPIDRRSLSFFEVQALRLGIEWHALYMENLELDEIALKDKEKSLLNFEARL